jgi:hypothetical protein
MTQIVRFLFETKPFLFVERLVVSWHRFHSPFF